MIQKRYKNFDFWGRITDTLGMFPKGQNSYIVMWWRAVVFDIVAYIRVLEPGDLYLTKRRVPVAEKPFSLYLCLLLSRTGDLQVVSHPW